ncbi:MAG: hypothetical protein NZ521_03490 [Flammeovirgaceae bacterium]|nr:hypothetical protein [Flammeovirgaceae bacterium]MDW8287222.1 hypothetical protein [Flammeovirgaceae bacterium]
MLSLISFRTLFFLVVVLARLPNLFAQSSKEMWTLLEDIDWEYRYSEIYQGEIGFPIFNEKVKALNGKEITLQGYFIPIASEDKEKEMVFSAYPNSSCFFCGAAGIESVIGVYFKKPRKFRPDQLVTFKGKLYLNSQETGLIYQLTEAEVVETN